MKLDEIDKKLINILQANTKQTNKQLSLQLNLSVTAVYERIKKLERDKVIEKYVALVNKEKVERSFIVFCHVKLIKHSKEYITKFEKEVLNLVEVAECFHVSGDYDYILKIYMKDMQMYRSFLVNNLTTLNSVASTHSTFVVGEVKHTTAVNV